MVLIPERIKKSKWNPPYHETGYIKKWTEMTDSSKAIIPKSSV